MQDLPVHFFTIVLNGEPFIRHHIEVFKQLPFEWHWHVVEGIAELKHDTAWSVANGGRILDELHHNGLSNDGTSEYLDAVAAEYPRNVTVYRTEGGRCWEGKLEMVQAPLPHISEECLLWEIDSDELWTVEQLCRGRKMFVDDAARSAAFYFCNMFMGEQLVTTTIDAYGNNRSYEWIRTWRFRPGFRWITHEPPRLGVQAPNGQLYDLAAINPFRHAETSARGLVFDHMAYATRESVEFKTVYYGYAGAVEQWRKLSEEVHLPARLADYCAWVTDEARVDSAFARGITPLALRNVCGEWRFRAHDAPEALPAVIVSVGELAATDTFATALLSRVRAAYPHSHLAVVCAATAASGYESSCDADSVVALGQGDASREDAVARIHRYGKAVVIQADGFQTEAMEGLLGSTSTRVVLRPDNLDTAALGAFA